ncbi:related to MRP4-mitochondrial ribosomal protein, small subunit [Rhynchosporium agropyri]|uniref:Related to MRP4-mitochondrial ribosomal protein, small subunit n=1 Tax=Rhynchosporium agropyri TaxID=914238 RepID=A0A1E1KB86_9HELO|nr:related to MRP4-mitochondrial ribosomal protein, small subunit [Rhynchosporium agropyri]
MAPPIMILRNVVLRQTQKDIASPIRKCCLRSLTTEALQSSSSSGSNSELHLAKSFRPPRSSQPKTPKPRTNQEVTTAHSLSLHIKKTTQKLGASVAPYYKPHTVLTKPPKPEDVTLELLMASQSHLGHATSLWNPMNQRYIFGVRQGVHVISLETTAAHLRRAAKVVEGVAYHGGLILFVGTRPGQAPSIVNAARMAKGCHLFEKWIPGSITNGNQILAKCGIKAVDVNDEMIGGYEDKVEGWRALRPDLVVVLNPLENYILLHECGLNNIPTIGIIDTDADPTWVTYPIPANDDSLRCTRLIASVLGRAGEEGQRKRLEAAKSGQITWKPTPGLGRPFSEEDRKKEEERISKRAAKGVVEGMDPTLVSPPALEVEEDMHEL